MNLQATSPTTVDDFLRWNEGREGKREFVRGRVIELMINVTRNHARLATRLVLQLAQQLDLDRFDVGTADFGVRTADGVRYPDVVVDLIGPASKGGDLAATAPVFLAEILSASSSARDLGEKVADYTALASLRHYLVLSQDEARFWLWSRDGSSWSGPLEASGTGVTLELPHLGASLDMDRLYAGIGQK